MSTFGNGYVAPFRDSVTTFSVTPPMSAWTAIAMPRRRSGLISPSRGHAKVILSDAREGGPSAALRSRQGPADALIPASAASAPVTYASGEGRLASLAVRVKSWCYH